MTTHSSSVAWRIPWTEEPGGLQPTELQTRHDWSDVAGAPVLLTHAAPSRLAATVSFAHSACPCGSGMPLWIWHAPVYLACPSVSGMPLWIWPAPVDLAFRVCATLLRSPIKSQFSFWFCNRDRGNSRLWCSFMCPVYSDGFYKWFCNWATRMRKTHAGALPFNQFCEWTCSGGFNRKTAATEPELKQNKRPPSWHASSVTVWVMHRYRFAAPSPGPGIPSHSSACLPTLVYTHSP